MSEIEFIANKKPRMDEDKEAIEDVEWMKIVSEWNLGD
jgi:hypothetical protein